MSDSFSGCTIKWRCSLNAMWRSPRRFRRRARLIRFPVRHNHAVRFAAVSPGLPDISRVTGHRGFGGHAPGEVYRCRSDAPDDSQILRLLIFEMTGAVRAAPFL